MKTTAILLISFILLGSIAFAQQNDPKSLFLSNKCNMCHSVSKADIKPKMPTKYPDLPNKILKNNKVDDLVKFIKQEANLGGKKHGLKFKGNDEELKSILIWLKELK